MKYTVRYQICVSDQDIYKTIEASNLEEATRLAKLDDGWIGGHLCLMDVYPVRHQYLIEVNGMVNGVPKVQKVYGSGVDEDEALNSASKLYRRVNGAFKRKSKNIVQVLNMAVV